MVVSSIALLIHRKRRHSASIRAPGPLIRYIHLAAERAVWASCPRHPPSRAQTRALARPEHAKEQRRKNHWRGATWRKSNCRRSRFRRSQNARSAPRRFTHRLCLHKRCHDGGTPRSKKHTKSSKCGLAEAEYLRNARSAESAGLLAVGQQHGTLSFVEKVLLGDPLDWTATCSHLLPR